MSVNERNAKTLLEAITRVEKQYGERLQALELLTKSLLIKMADLEHRLTVLISTTSSTGPTERKFDA